MVAHNISYLQALESFSPNLNRSLSQYVDHIKLIEQYHPDSFSHTSRNLLVGGNKGDICHSTIADLLHSYSMLENFNIETTRLLRLTFLLLVPVVLDVLRQLKLQTMGRMSYWPQS